jgi:type I restriction enzyme S subunit
MGELSLLDKRWDAVFQAGLSTAVRQRIEDTGEAGLRVTQVAELVNDRLNPARLGAGRTFQYIEISDVDGEGHTVRAKEIHCSKAPSRARKRVAAGDILVSTVRPERRTIGVVPLELDGAICSTGFAVLRCKDHVPPLVLASILRHPFCTEQLVKQNSGIAYPTIEEDRVLEVVLPIEREQLRAMISLGSRLSEAKRGLNAAMAIFSSEVASAVNAWMDQTKLR